MSVLSLVPQKYKSQPQDITRGKIRWSPKSAGFIQWEPWTSVPTSMSIQQLIQFGPKRYLVYISVVCYNSDQPTRGKLAAIWHSPINIFNLFYLFLSPPPHLTPFPFHPSFLLSSSPSLPPLFLSFVCLHASVSARVMEIEASQMRTV